jgi:RNA polymerase sigma-70 factor (ECF subfamily)
MKNEPREAWLAKLMQEWEARLFRYARRFVNFEVARELVQESFIRLWGAPHDVVGREREWLFHVCRNLAIDHLRKNRRVVLLNEEGVLIPETEELLQQQEAATELQRITSSLPPAQREVIRLKFQESMSYQQISQVTGHSVSHVGVLIHQAMATMKNRMSRKDKP